ncbi:sensor histidine kinase [Adhaeribacter rhizoryzae]|uniref:histidine kinase n=1 Tax=Adhaeribacter rhizoryzae TaxID=2607907 RepID=A0A5M6DED9_9BACT|nr:HAMP domain-containing sensor histidine kinase [Adhaeribacter rhizoryzae]KAA5544760.1 HAMP domain-containing histidine kinase [Adhaeribacter rhizoryzae]
MNEDRFVQCQKQLAQVKKEFEEFVYLVSHDLNAPIRAISNLLGWISEDLGPNIPDDVQQNIKLLQDRAQRLEKMLSAILALSRVSRTNLETGYIELPAFLENISEKYRNNNSFITIQAEPIGFTTYYQKLSAVINELLTNALKHSDKELTTIQLTATRVNNFLQLLITDNGSGFAPEIQERIFSLFYTARSKEETENIGAGLTVARSITNFAGGNLTINQAKAGEGSSFILLWPLHILETT